MVKTNRFKNCQFWGLSKYIVTCSATTFFKLTIKKTNRTIQKAYNYNPKPAPKRPKLSGIKSTVPCYFYKRLYWQLSCDEIGRRSLLKNKFNILLLFFKRIKWYIYILKFCGVLFLFKLFKNRVMYFSFLNVHNFFGHLQYYFADFLKLVKYKCTSNVLTILYILALIWEDMTGGGERELGISVLIKVH